MCAHSFSRGADLEVFRVKFEKRGLRYTALYGSAALQCMGRESFRAFIFTGFKFKADVFDSERSSKLTIHGRLDPLV